MTSPTKRHYWLPISNDLEPKGGTRHAFDGRCWGGDPSGTTLCGKKVLMSPPVEIQWILYPTCMQCNRTAKERANV